MLGWPCSIILVLACDPDLESVLGTKSQAWPRTLLTGLAN